MSYTCGEDNSDVVDQSAIKSRVPGVLGSIQLRQVAGITGEGVYISTKQSTRIFGQQSS